MLRTSPRTVIEDYHRLMNLARLPGGAAQERRHGPQDQHLLALLLPRQLHHPLAAGRRGAGDAAGRLCARADPRLPQPHRRDRRPPGRAREQADRRDPRPRPSQRPSLRRRGVDPRPRRGGIAGRRVPVPEPGLPRRLLDPQALHRREHPASAHGQDPRLHHHHRRDEERVRRPAQRAPALDAPGDPPDAGRPADDPEEDPLRHLRGDGRHLRRGRARAALHDPAREERAARERRSGGDRRGRGEADGLRSDVDSSSSGSRTSAASAAAIRARSRSSETRMRRASAGTSSGPSNA